MTGNAARRRRSAAFLLCAALLALGGCDCGRAARPNILLVVIDTLRADHLGCYDYARPTSPAIDSLSRQGVTFDAAYTTAPWTLPAFASLLTSRYPWEHGASNDFFPVDPALPTVARELKRAGYETAAFVSHIYTSSDYGFQAGFDRFEEFGITENYRFDEGREPVAARVVGRAADLLRRGELREPFFLLVHLFDPHWDYAAPGEWRDCFTGPAPPGIDGTYRTISRYLPVDSLLAPEELDHVVDLYDGEIRYVDNWVDSLLAAFDRRAGADRSLVVLTADHGEEFQDHRSMGHAFTFYDEVLRVPLVVRDRSRLEAARRSGAPVSLLDVLPTILDAAGVEAPPAARGRSLYDDAEPAGRILLAGTTREGRFGRAALGGGSKLVWDRDGYRLYRPGDDPGELRDLLAVRPADAARLESALAAGAAPGGWTIRWRADSTGTIDVEGSLEVNGFLVGVVPLSAGDFRLLSSSDRAIRFAASTPGCVSIRTEPPSAPVTFRLAVDGAEEPGRIGIGRDQFTPPAASFGLDPGSVEPGTLDAPPEGARPALPFVSIWKESGGPPREKIHLDEEQRERLRALGYF